MKAYINPEKCIGCGACIVWNFAIERRRYCVMRVSCQVTDNGVNIPAYHNGAVF